MGHDRVHLGEIDRRLGGAVKGVTGTDDGADGDFTGERLFLGGQQALVDRQAVELGGDFLYRAHKTAYERAVVTGIVLIRGL